MWQVVGSSAFLRNIWFERSVFLFARVCKRSVFCLKMGLYRVCIFVTIGLYGYLGTLLKPIIVLSLAQASNNANCYLYNTHSNLCGLFGAGSNLESFLGRLSALNRIFFFLFPLLFSSLFQLFPSFFLSTF